MTPRSTASILGRKRIYGYEVLILAIGAIASALQNLLNDIVRRMPEPLSDP